MYLKKIVENEEVNLWISELNKSFKNRSSASIPFKEVKSKDIVIDNNNMILGIYNDANKLLGGHFFHIAWNIITSRLQR